MLAAFQAGTPFLSLTELSRHLDLSKSCVHALLASLERGGFVSRDARPGKYGLGPRVLQLASLRLEQSTVRSLARPILERLAHQLRETVFLGILDGDQAIYADRIESRKRLRVAGEIGRPVPLHATALGKTLLAFSSEERIACELARPLKAYTCHTLVDPDRVRDELVQIRAQGVAISRGEHDEFTAGVAAPVYDQSGALVAGITIAGPLGRLAIEKAAAAALAGASDISAQLGASSRSAV
ncbi:MAG: IclR family transcriptional regulator [Chloroflexota bacterium]|nr:IclR family transcriptional regulator [Chloroflexota bacterium]